MIAPLLGLLVLSQTPSPPAVDAAAVRLAVERALPPIASGAREYPKHRDCFSCHNQAMPMLALVTARSRGFPVDDELTRGIVEHTETDLSGAADVYRKGQGQGGGATRAGYALWAMANGGLRPDETTDAVVEFLLIRDNARGYWRTSSSRPPSEASSFTSTFLAMRGLHAYAGRDQRGRAAERIARGREWLKSAFPRDTEDRVFRLLGLREGGASPSTIRAATEALLSTRREDGGWAQREGLPSDAYATGSALYALRTAGGLPTDDPAYREGLAFLIRSQRDDGTWHVASRSKPFQTYFESGFPHGTDQFIAIAASSWATAALALALPPGSP